MLRVVSDSLDPYRNLAAEDLLLDRVGAWGPLLLLWRCDRTVIIGKNQNPWRECSLPAMRHKRVRLARRVSGGGAVYHDLGNLNYAWFCPRANYERGRVFARVIEALQALGLQARRMGNTSLAVDGRKVSGTAFCYRRDAVLHHGTLLIDADLDALRQCLAGSGRGIATRAVPSEPAPVANLTEWIPDPSIPAIADALAASLGDCRSSQIDFDALPTDALRRRTHELRHPDWILGHTPTFSWDLDGPLPLRFSVDHGRITSITGHGDAAPAAQWLEARLHGRLLTAENIRESLQALPTTPEAASALEQWAASRLPDGGGGGVIVDW